MSKHYYIIPIFVPHKGCPHNCVFCNQKEITGQIDMIHASDVKRIIDSYLNTINKENSYVEVSFFGGSFTGIPLDYQNELLSAAHTEYLNGKVDAIRLSTRPDYIDEDILDNLKRYDVKTIELGVQSMDDSVLLKSERGHTQEDVIKASKLIKKYGFKLGLQMMVGLIDDSLNKDIYTCEQIIKLKPDFVRIYPALVLKNTNMATMFYDGTYHPLTVDEAISVCKVLYLKFTQNNIPIIRIGLQPTEDINIGRDIISGPFHPAFRELLESAILNDMMIYLIGNEFNESKLINVCVNNKSKLYSDKKRYFRNSENLYKNIIFNIIEIRTISSMTIIIEDCSKTRKLSIHDYINMAK